MLGGAGAVLVGGDVPELPGPGRGEGRVGAHGLRPELRAPCASQGEVRSHEPIPDEPEYPTRAVASPAAPGRELEQVPGSLRSRPGQAGRSRATRATGGGSA